MTNSIFKVDGKKIETLLLGEKALMFSSQSLQTEEEFNKAWSKTLTLATKTEIKYDSIKSVTKEDSEETILIKYKGALGVPNECEFSFPAQSDCEAFFSFLEKEQYFRRTDERISPVKSATPYIIGLAVTIAITLFAHFQAVDIANGTADESGSRKTRAFMNIIGLIGDKGVWTIGILVSCFIAYKIWKRFKNPPVQTKFLPQ